MAAHFESESCMEIENFLQPQVLDAVRSSMSKYMARGVVGCVGWLPQAIP
jgi:hypothetical protein